MPCRLVHGLEQAARCSRTKNQAWESGASRRAARGEKGTGYFSSGFLGLPRLRIVDSKPSVATMFACQSSLPNGCCRLTQVRSVTSS